MQSWAAGAGAWQESEAGNLVMKCEMWVTITGYTDIGCHVTTTRHQHSPRVMGVWLVRPGITLIEGIWETIFIQ